jgi:hypothetical protein
MILQTLWMLDLALVCFSSMVSTVDVHSNSGAITNRNWMSFFARRLFGFHFDFRIVIVVDDCGRRTEGSSSDGLVNEQTLRSTLVGRNNSSSVVSTRVLRFTVRLDGYSYGLPSVLQLR